MSLQLGIVLICVVGGLSSPPSTENFLCFIRPSQECQHLLVTYLVGPQGESIQHHMKGSPKPASGRSRAGWDPCHMRLGSPHHPGWAPLLSIFLPREGQPWPHTTTSLELVHPLAAPPRLGLSHNLPGRVGRAELATFLASSGAPSAAPLASQPLPSTATPGAQCYRLTLSSLATESMVKTLHESLILVPAFPHDWLLPNPAETDDLWCNNTLVFTNTVPRTTWSDRGKSPPSSPTSHAPSSRHKHP
jgi:hypothetical protein